MKVEEPTNSPVLPMDAPLRRLHPHPLPHHTHSSRRSLGGDALNDHVLANHIRLVIAVDLLHLCSNHWLAALHHSKSDSSSYLPNNPMCQRSEVLASQTLGKASFLGESNVRTRARYFLLVSRLLHQDLHLARHEPSHRWHHLVRSH